MIRETFPVGLLGCNCTILGDERSREAIVIDPGDDVPRILQVLERHQLTCTRILVTHAHFDHIAAAGTLKSLTGAPISYNQQDLPLVAIMDQQPTWIGLPKASPPVPVQPPDHSPADLETVRIGDLAAEILFTPGHTEGSISLYLPAETLLIAGDTLFAGSVGRSDFPGGDAGKLMASIRDRLLPLPAETVVVPGHGPETTIGREAHSNPFLT